MKNKYEFNPVVIPLLMLFGIIFALFIFARCHS